MKERLILVLFWALVLHLIVSAVFIFYPSFLRDTRISVIHKKYFLPGPFFSDSTIVDSYSVNLSWKMKGRWTSPINPAKENFDRYHATLNPSWYYRSRVIRMIRLSQSDSSVTDIKDREEFSLFKRFLYEEYIPAEADSVRMWIINKKAQNFMMRKDSTYITFLR